ncbi:MAG: phosphoribosylaminoimidazole-succinocarboxamide synthase [Planctomycetota bacterium]|nr:MAG: phosphoribosylaminoimidazole-succinocarboxamide synthase [Planctomycetota bacterium]
MGAAGIAEALRGLPLLRRGKVRELVDLGERLLLVATDRLSAFDWVLPTPIPDRGRVLTQLSRFWFERTRALVPNHMITTELEPIAAALGRPAAALGALEGRAMLVRRAARIDFECVVRGYLAGSGYRDYRQTGAVCGVELPSGLEPGDRLAEPIFTPATKAETGHDENVPFAALASAVGAETAERLRAISILLYRELHAHALERGLILADTKFEFGRIDGELVLIDEAGTPDSSRYWDRAAWEERRCMDSFDKQFVRDWLEASGWDKSSPPPALPPEIVAQTRERYLEAFRRLTGSELPLPAGPAGAGEQEPAR